MSLLRSILGRLDFSPRGWARVWALTALGTLFCIAFAFVFDSFSFTTGEWHWGASPLNNVLIPLCLAPPFFVLLLSKMRDLAIAHHELLIVASTDGLTACLNRAAFTTLVQAYLERTDQHAAGQRGALLVIDVDHFKTVNDRFGHDCGDEALRNIAGAIRGTVRDVDLVGRMGGEEFGVFLPGASPAQSVAIAERIRSAVHHMAFEPRGQRAPLSVSVGGAAFEAGSSFGELYRHADQHLYRAKELGRNRVELARFDRYAAGLSSVH